MIPLNQPPVGSQIIEKRVEIKAIEGEIRSIEAQIKKVGRCDQQRLLEKITCAQMYHNIMSVRFRLSELVAENFTSTASWETMAWEAERNSESKGIM